MAALEVLICEERLAFIALLESLRTEEWAAPSLCREWTVQEVAAHLAVAPITPFRRTLVSLARNGFRVNRLNAEVAKTWARGGRPAILQQLRSNAETEAKPYGVPMPAVLTDAVVHALDVRRPLGRNGSQRVEAFIQVARFCLELRPPLTALMGGSPRRRVQGLRLVTSDIDWAYGKGPEVIGTSDSLLLLLAGRPV